MVKGNLVDIISPLLLMMMLLPFRLHENWPVDFFASLIGSEDFFDSLGVTVIGSSVVGTRSVKGVALIFKVPSTLLPKGTSGDFDSRGLFSAGFWSLSVGFIAFLDNFESGSLPGVLDCDSTVDIDFLSEGLKLLVTLSVLSTSWLEVTISSVVDTASVSILSCISVNDSGFCDKKLRIIIFMKWLVSKNNFKISSLNFHIHKKTPKIKLKKYQIDFAIEQWQYWIITKTYKYFHHFTDGWLIRIKIQSQFKKKRSSHSWTNNKQTFFFWTGSIKTSSSSLLLLPSTAESDEMLMTYSLDSDSVKKVLSSSL